MSIPVEGIAQPVLIHFDQMCNYCGNCTVFCPYEGDPYRSKLSLFATLEEFQGSDLPGFYRLSPRQYWIRLGGPGSERQLDLDKGQCCPDCHKLLETLEAKYTWIF